MISVFARAFRSAREQARLWFVAASVIAAALLLLGLYGLALTNAGLFVASWERDTQISAYFDTAVAPETQEAVRQTVSARPEVARVDYVSSADALAWMKEHSPEVAPVLADLGDDALPASLEITLRPSYGSPERIEAFVADIQKGGSFSDVDWGQEWVGRFDAMVSILATIGAGVGVFVTVLALFVVANTVNLVIAARRDELEITRLVGATDGWILGPFLVEGAFQGLFGAGVALAATWGVHRVVADRLGDSLTIAFGTSHLQFLPPQWITLLVVAGLVLGVGAPWAAVSRFLRRLR